MYIPAAAGFKQIWGRLKSAAVRFLFVIVVFLPMLVSAVQVNRYWRLPDTRTAAQAWVKTNIPEGSKIFITDYYNAPQLMMNNIQLERLYSRTVELNHPRKDYFRLLLEGYKAGGYELYYLKRTIFEVTDIAHRTETAYQAQDAIDLKETGMQELVQQKIGYAIINPVPDDNPNFSWQSDLRRHSVLLSSFVSRPGASKGPTVEIYKIQ